MTVQRRLKRLPNLLFFICAILILYIVFQKKDDYEIKIEKKEKIDNFDQKLDDLVNQKEDADQQVEIPAGDSDFDYPEVYDHPHVEIRQSIAEINFKEITRNEAKFPRNENGPVFLVQVHEKVDFFKFLIENLRNVIGIEEALLIVSSDVYNKEINQIVKSIDFMQVRHIFYPYSYVFFPDQFPGTDPNDCSRDIPKHEAIKQKCNNAECKSL